MAILACYRRSTNAVSVGLGFAAVFLLATTALSATTAECERLRRAISDASHSSGGQYQAATERQRAELDRTASYAQQIGCDNHKFLIFGSDPPAKCGQIRAQMDRMRANLQDLQSRGGGNRGELIARYNDECAAGHAPNVLEALFGQQRSSDMEERPLSPDPDEDVRPMEHAVGPSSGQTMAGGKAVCVRACDGAFFPVSYSANSGRLDNLAEMCRALCPNADVTLYTYPSGGEIEQAVSIDGARYVDSPTALKFRKSYDPSCSCKRRGQTWVSALGAAEELLAQDGKRDTVVTPEKAAELSKPKADVKAKAPKAGPVAIPVPSSNGPVGATDANGVDTALRDATANISRDTSGIAGGADGAQASPLSEQQGKTFDEVGADGSRKKVRQVGN